MALRHILTFTLQFIWLASFVMRSNPGALIEISIPPVPTTATAGGDNFGPLQDPLNAAEDQSIWEGIQKNIQQLRDQGLLAKPDSASPVLFDWPVRLAAGINDYSGFSISAFPDHNPNPGPWVDYNGGSRTYDTHRGTDIALWPFSWNKLDAGDVQVVAAAAGTITEKQNGTPADHNCGSGSGGLGNYIVLAHADGRVTIYGHMKYNSLTTKGVGQTVTSGETLGTVGSSGNSSGPHLHFEVRSSNGPAELWIDPYTGPANLMASSWKSQRPYSDSAINKIATATAFPINEDCKPTITNIQDSFPASAHIAFQVYYRDYQGSLPTYLHIYDPNGNGFQTWTYTDANTAFSRAAGRYWSFDFPANAVSGSWRFEAQYNGQTYQTSFNLNAPSNLPPKNFLFVPFIFH